MKGAKGKDQPDLTIAPQAKKPSQKLRAPNSYNLFVKDFFKSTGEHIESGIYIYNDVVL